MSKAACAREAYDAVVLKRRVMAGLATKNLTHAQFQDRSGVSREVLRKSFLVGESDPCLSTVVRTANALGMTASELLEGIDRGYIG